VESVVISIPCNGDQTKKDELGRHVARMENNRKPYRVLVWKPEGKGDFGNQRFKGDDNI